VPVPVPIPIPVEVEEEKPVQQVAEEDIAKPVVPFYYSVQIIAKQKSELDTQLFRNKYKFDREIVHNEHEGFHIYTTGQYQTYDEARIARDQIISENNINDAFIVAFGNGVRMNKLP